MIHKGQAPGTPLDVLALIEAIPPDDRDVNCHYLLGEIYKKLDEELNEEQLALPRTVNGTGHTGPSEFCATSI